jgi:predicted DNA-binding transcriptional regulator YafY
MAVTRELGLNSEKPTVTVERAARLYQMLTILGRGPQTRGALARRLGLDIRGFYRDLELLRMVGIIVETDSRRYRLRGAVAEAIDLLPLPDPRLTLGEATNLAKGRKPAHRKLAAHLARIVGPKSKPRQR